MSIATSTAIGIAGVAAAGGGIASGLIGAGSAKSAANTQAGAAEYAANLQAELAQENLGFQEELFNEGLANQAPWLQSGSSAMVNLDSLLGITPSTFSSTPVPDTGPLQFPQFTLNPNSPNPVESNTNGVPGFGSAGSWMTPSAQTTVPLASLSGNMNSATSQIPSVGGPGGPPVGGLAFSNGFEGGPVRAPGQGPVSLTRGNPGVGTSGGAATVAPSTGGVRGPSGQVPLSSLVNPALGPEGSLMSPFPYAFQAPTSATEQNDPGFQFRLQQGQQALENSAAARGGLLSGGTGKALENYAQDYASNEYQNVYNRSLTEYQQAYNQFEQQQQNQFNRLASIAGIGQTSAGQLNSQAANTGNTLNNLLLGSGAQIGQNINNAGAARASGYVGAGNAYGGIASSLGGLGSLLPLYSLLGGGAAPWQQAASNPYSGAGGTAPGG